MLSRRPERGSIALVVMVVFVMAGLATVMVSRVVSDSRVVIVVVSALAFGLIHWSLGLHAVIVTGVIGRFDASNG